MGESLAKTGRCGRAAHRAQPTSLVARGSWAQMRSLSIGARFGQLAFDFDREHVGAVEHLGRGTRSRRRCDPTPTRSRARRARAARGDRRASHASMPGPWRPTAFTIPDAVMCSRGAGLPGPRLRTHRLGRDRAEPRRVAQPRDLVAVTERPAGREHRAREGRVRPEGRRVKVGEPPALHLQPELAVAVVLLERPDRGLGRLPLHDPAEAASAAATVVTHGMPRAVAVRRMWAPSARGPRPRGVLTTRSIFPDSSSSTASSPSLSSRRFAAGRDLADRPRRPSAPLASRAAAVPAVATSV